MQRVQPKLVVGGGAAEAFEACLRAEWCLSVLMDENEVILGHFRQISFISG